MSVTGWIMLAVSVISLSVWTWVVFVYIPWETDRRIKKLRKRGR